MKLSERAILLIWFVGYPVALFMYALLRNIGHSGGEQVIMTIIARGILLYFIGFGVFFLFGAFNQLIKRIKRKNERSLID